MRWEQGRATQEQMIDAKELQRVPASREHADRLLAESQRHIASAATSSTLTPKGLTNCCMTVSAKHSPRSSPTRACTPPPAADIELCTRPWQHSPIRLWVET